MSSLYKRRSPAEADRGKKKFRNFAALAVPRLFVGDAVPAVPFCAVPVLPCRGGRLCPPWMTAAPRRAGPMCPAVPSTERCHSEPVTVSPAWESVSLGWGRTDCRVASLLAMTECVGHAVPDVPLRAVPVLPCRGGCLRPPWMTAVPRRAGPMCPAVSSAPRCHSEPVRAAKQVPLGYTLA